MNEFVNRVEKRNDAIDSGMGFFVSFGFFATLFIIATVIKVVGS
ncbi:YqzM family protein [Neobacillus sp. LXY-4]